MFTLKKINLALVFLILLVTSSNIRAFEFSSEELTFAKAYLSNAIQSSNPNDIIIGTLISNKIKHFVSFKQFYSQGLKQDINHKLWVDQVIKECLLIKTILNCKLNTQIEKLKQIDSLNAVPLVYSAVFHARNTKFELAHKELEKAANREIYDDYYWKRFALSLEVLKANGYPKKHLHTASIKLAHDTVSQLYAETQKLCRKQAKLSIGWKNTCIKLGKLLKSKSTLFLGNMVGLALQREALNLDEDDSEKLAEVKEEREKLNQWRTHAVKTLDFIEAQKRGPDYYYDDLINFGERTAIENALKRHRTNK